MCITFLYVNNEAGKCEYQIILASNRDEFYNRPSKAAHRWPDYPHCISGIDLEVNKSGGTWLGVSEMGRIGNLLNISKADGPDKSKKGRGFLVTNFLKGDTPAREYLLPVAADRHNYNPFHLVLLEKRGKKWDTYYVDSEETDTPLMLDGEFHGWSNGSKSMPWEKEKHGLAQFSDILHKHKDVYNRDTIVKELMTFLNNPTPHLPDPSLQMIHLKKGEEAVKRLSGIYVDLKAFNYGTRTNTLVLIDGDGNGEFIERTMLEPITPENPAWNTQTIPFKIQDI